MYTTTCKCYDYIYTEDIYTYCTCASKSAGVQVTHETGNTREAMYCSARIQLEEYGGQPAKEELLPQGNVCSKIGFGAVWSHSDPKYQQTSLTMNQSHLLALEQLVVGYDGMCDVE